MSIAENEAVKEAKLVRFTKKDMERIKKLARRKGLSFASFVRMIVLEYLDQQVK